MILGHGRAAVPCTCNSTRVLFYIQSNLAIVKCINPTDPFTIARVKYMCVVETVRPVASVEYSQVFTAAGFTIARFDCNTEQRNRTQVVAWQGLLLLN